MRRREVVALLGAGMTPGCFSQTNETPRRESPTSTETQETVGSPTPAETRETPGTPTPASDSPSGTDQATPTCASDKVLVSEYVAAIESEMRGLVISATPQAVHPGDEVTIELRNESSETRETGNQSKYDVQRRVSQGWRSIFWRDSNETVFYHDDAVLHEPGGGFTWDLKLTRAELTHDIENGMGTLHVCPAIEPGLYRFVFHGATKYDDDGSEVLAHLGTRFEVIAE